MPQPGTRGLYSDGGEAVQWVDDLNQEKVQRNVRADNRLPGAIEVLYNKMCEKIGLSDEKSSKWLDHCQKCSEVKMNEIMESEKKKKKENNR